MPEKLPDTIKREDVLEAISAFDKKTPHRFAESTKFDVLHRGKRYPPKALVGIAARRYSKTELGPRDFKGGLGSKCFRILARLGFEIVPKEFRYVPKEFRYPEEGDEDSIEGALQVIRVNRYERDPQARRACIRYFGAKCSVCRFDFEHCYGELGKGYIHVHHLRPLSKIGRHYKVNPKVDLRPVCPNCHAMLHAKDPCITIDQLKLTIANLTNT